MLSKEVTDAPNEPPPLLSDKTVEMYKGYSGDLDPLGVSFKTALDSKF